MMNNSPRKIPNATYRLQLNSSFGFLSVLEILNYLKELGISHVYASPIFKARKSSPHGYDAVDPLLLNPELGTPEDFDTLIQHLKKLDMGWLQDIVPNHMAYDYANPVLRDLLEYGPNSAYHDFFDSDLWRTDSSFDGKLAAPFLGDHFEKCLLAGQIRLNFNMEGFSIHYYDLRLPLAIASYSELIEQIKTGLFKYSGKETPATRKLSGLSNRFNKLAQKKPGPERTDLAGDLKAELWEIYGKNSDVTSGFDRMTQIINGDPENEKTFFHLTKLLAAQFYQLRFWKTAGDEINYRRFFDINELIALRQEKDSVFLWSHQFILQLIHEGKINGLRIDHIDGLVDPGAYLNRLRKEAGDIYLVVEKILEHHESLPASWPVHGTTGYEFSSRVESLFVHPKNEKTMRSILNQFAPGIEPFETALISAKKQILTSHFMGDLDNLVDSVRKSAMRLSAGTDITRRRLEEALGEVLIRFPVYRTYTASGNITSEDKSRICHAIDDAATYRPDMLYEFEFIKKILLKTYDIPSDPETDPGNTRKRAVACFEQLTAPLMAKGLEDTTHYRYPLLLSLNEVGNAPDRFGTTRRAFHEYMAERAKKWPYAMSSSSTHDSKRGEDIRARLNVLSEIPDQWGMRVFGWHNLNRQKKILLKGVPVPDSTEEYFIYQTLLGSWYLDKDTEPPYLERLEAYMVKFLREAKVHSSWHSPDETYEKAVISFVRTILEQPRQNNPFMQDFLPFCRHISFYGIFNSLSQTLIKITAPGVPDFFQGAELMNLSLVDPDNRRPVGYKRRKELMLKNQKTVKDKLTDAFPEPDKLPAEADRLKLFLIMKSLNFRKDYSRLFLDGAYIPMEITGRFSNHVVAFARRMKNQWSITAVPRFLTEVTDAQQTPLGKTIWKDTAAVIPFGAPERWKNVLTDQSLTIKNEWPIGKLFEFFPVALLTGD